MMHSSNKVETMAVKLAKDGFFVEKEMARCTAAGKPAQTSNRRVPMLEAHNLHVFP